MRPSPNKIIRKIPPDIVEAKRLFRGPSRIEVQLLVGNLQVQFLKESEGLSGREPMGYILVTRLVQAARISPTVRKRRGAYRKL